MEKLEFDPNEILFTHKYFQIFDSKAEAYQPPFYVKTRGIAMRAFVAAANDPSGEIGRFPADYTLFECGEWSEFSGEHAPYEAKKAIGAALEFVERQER